MTESRRYSVREFASMSGVTVRNCTTISALEEKKGRLEITIKTVRAAEARFRAGGEPNLKDVIDVMEMEK